MNLLLLLFLLVSRWRRRCWSSWDSCDRWQLRHLNSHHHPLTAAAAAAAHAISVIYDCDFGSSTWPLAWWVDLIWPRLPSSSANQVWNLYIKSSLSRHDMSCSSISVSIPLVAVFTDYDYVFSENGLVAHKNGELIGTQVSLRAPYMYRSTLNSSPSNLVSRTK